MRADRLLRLIVLLQRHGRATAGWLAEQLEVSERTILRDMEALSAAGVPVYTERGPQGGCVLLEGFTTDASGLTTSEAQALFAWTSRESVADLGLGPQLSGALAKVAASASSSVVEHAEALGAVLLSDRRRWFADAEQVPVLPVLREAAQAGRRLRLRYRSAGAAGARCPDGRPVRARRPVRRLVPRRHPPRPGPHLPGLADRVGRGPRPAVAAAARQRPRRGVGPATPQLRERAARPGRPSRWSSTPQSPASSARWCGRSWSPAPRSRCSCLPRVVRRRRGAVATPAARTAPRRGRGPRLGARGPGGRPGRHRGRRTTAGGDRRADVLRLRPASTGAYGASRASYAPVDVPSGPARAADGDRLAQGRRQGGTRGIGSPRPGTSRPGARCR